MAPLETEEIGRAWTEYLNYLQERVNELKSLFFFRIDETDEKNLQRITACLRESNETLNKAENLLHNLKVYVQSEQEAQEEGQILKDLIESFDSKVKTVLKQLPEGDQSYVGNCIKDTTYSYGTGTQESEMLPQNQKQQTSEKKRVSSAHSPSNNISSITVGKVSADELSQVPQYLKGRLTTEKVNQIIDKLDALFREKYTLLSKPLRTLSSAEIDRVTDYRNQEVDQVANSYFLSDQDLKNCSSLKFDTTTKNTLHVLRHLGRLKENCGALAAEEEKFRRAESYPFFGCWSRYGSPSRSAHPARFSPDDKFSRQRVTIKKRFGLLLTQQPENPL